MLGYLFERAVCASFAIPCFITALQSPGMYTFLTYWTLLLHLVYFSIDKASPKSTLAVRLLHGFSFVGAAAVLVGYAVISVGGSMRFGTWLEWERHTGVQDLSSHSFEYIALLKSWEHLWPMLVHLVDARLNRANLQRSYAGSRGSLNLVMALVSYLVFGSVWESLMVVDKGANTLIKYNQPMEWTTSKLLARAGVNMDDVLAALKVSSLPEDIIFSTGQKLMMLTVAYTTYSAVVLPLATAAKSKKKKA